MASYPDPAQIPDPEGRPVVVFTGRSNSGKSSLISALCNHKNLARSSKTAGKTRLLNYFYVPKPLPDQETGGIFFVDTPGYGHAALSKEERASIRIMVDNFLLQAPGITLVIIILDARRKIGQEEAGILKYCTDHGKPVIMARTKWDTMNAAEKKSARDLWKKEGIYPWCFPVSSTKKNGLDTLLSAIRSTVSDLLLS